MDEELQKKHRQWLKQFERQRFRIGMTESNIAENKWLQDYQDSKYDPGINNIEIGKRKFVIEFDSASKIDVNKECTKEQINKWLNETAENLEKDNTGYERFSHNGVSDHVHGDLNRDATKEEKLSIIKFYTPKESWEFLDKSLCSEKHLIAAAYCPHWKHGTIKTLVKRYSGRPINVDDEKYKPFLEPEYKQETISNFSNSGITAEIVRNVKISDLALQYGARRGKGTTNYHCNFHDDKNPSLSLDDKRGFFKCHADSCGKEGNIVDFVAEAEHISKEEAVKRLIEKAGISNNENKVVYNLDLQNKNNKEKDTRIKIKLPNKGRLISNFAQEVADVLRNKNILFFRTDSREVVEIGKLKNEYEQTYTGFLYVKPNRFITLAEKYIIPGEFKIIVEGENTITEFKPKSMSAELANTVLQSHILEETLLKIDRIFTFPLPIIYKEELTFPKIGYDERFRSWLPPNSPKISNPSMPLEEAKEIIYEILKEFVLKNKQDYTNAIAGLITPALRGLYPRFNVRTPVFFYTANRERAGKDFLAGITGLVYEGAALEEPPICNTDMKWSSDDELRKKILSALLSGRKRLHFANNKGYLNNAVFEAVITSEKYTDRILGKNESPIFDNELEFSLSGNVGIGFTPDLANRSRFVKLFLAIEDANARNFERPNLHKWVLENRELIISAVYALIRNWFEKGCPSGKLNFASFPEWARICGGIMEAAGYESPCTPDKESILLGGDSETLDMKSLFELCYEKKPDTPLYKGEIRQLIEHEDIFLYLDFSKRSDQTIFGNKINKFVGRVLSDIKMIVKDSSVRSSRQQYIFTKEKEETDKSTIFGYFPKKDGNLGNLHNLLHIDNHTIQNNNEVNSITLPTLRRLPNLNENDEDIEEIHSNEDSEEEEIKDKEEQW
ncbi:MAG: CHC2 zinc finger domain-containing protein [Candidatus Nanoarchaeia archaeon]|nr:CHC2 zinc finger domain-containing protein [Candidatus Nanoarchaeia archaeon]